MPAPRTIASVRAMGTCLRETKRDVANIYGSGRAKSVSQAGGMADMPQDYSLAHVLGGEPVTAPDQVRGRLSPGHARGSHSMAYLDLPAAALAWLGRQGTRAVAVSLYAGLALPPPAASMKAIFTPNLFVLL